MRRDSTVFIRPAAAPAVPCVLEMVVSGGWVDRRSATRREVAAWLRAPGAVPYVVEVGVRIGGGV